MSTCARIIASSARERELLGLVEVGHAHDRDLLGRNVTTEGPDPEGSSADCHGRPTTVVAATEVMEGRPCFEVEFSDGSTIVADAEHLWQTSTRAERRGLRDGVCGLLAANDQGSAFRAGGVEQAAVERGGVGCDRLRAPRGVEEHVGLALLEEVHPAEEQSGCGEEDGEGIVAPAAARCAAGLGHDSPSRRMRS